MPLESGERMPKRSWMQRALRIEPGISLAQWAIDRVTSNWPVLSSAFVAGGGMSYLATLTAWASAAGPLGIGVIGLTTALLTNLLLAWAQAKRAQARERNVLAEITQNWVTKSDVINPLNPEFHRVRINISELRHPVYPVIERKRFIDCQLVGPANLVINGGSITSAAFSNCDLVLVKENAKVMNAVMLDNCQIYGGELVNVTIIIQPRMLQSFKDTEGVYFVTLINDSKFDI